MCLGWQMAEDDPKEQDQHSATAVQTVIDRLQRTQSIKCAINSVHKAPYTDVRLPL